MLCKNASECPNTKPNICKYIYLKCHSRGTMYLHATVLCHLFLYDVFTSQLEWLQLPSNKSSSKFQLENRFMMSLLIMVCIISLATTQTCLTTEFIQTTAMRG